VRFGLRAKIFWIAGGVMALAVVAMTLTAAWRFSEANSRAISERSVAIAHELATQFERLLALGLQAEEIVGFEEQCDKVMRNHADLAWVAVLTPQGKVLFHSAGAPVGADGVYAELRDAAAREGERQVAARIGGGAVLATLKSLGNAAGEHVGAVVVAHSQAALDARVRDLFLSIALVGIVFLGVSGYLLLWAMSRFVTRPLGEVFSAVERMRGQAPEAHKRVEVRAEAELGMLIDAFNGLLGRLEDYQRELIAAREQAEAANTAKSEFLATISHELRTPLNGVLGMSALLQRTPLNDKQTRYVGAVDQSGRKLLEIIEEILDFTSMESGGLVLENQPFGLRAALLEVEHEHAAGALEKGLALSCQVDAACADQVHGDAKRLRQVLGHLVGNAIKFTERGQVAIAARALDAARVELRVADTGIGIAPELRDIVFQPFRQADGSHSRRYGGTGLGLSICKRLVEAMRGEIGFASTPGQGTTFTVVLPLLGAAEAAP
jgi:signal transduction histidine kinase